MIVAWYDLEFLVNIGSGNGLQPNWHHVISSTNVASLSAHSEQISMMFGQQYNFHSTNAFVYIVYKRWP